MKLCAIPVLLVFLIAVMTRGITASPAIPEPANRDCLTDRVVFADGNVATISGKRLGARVAETYVREHGGWALWMRYRAGRAWHPSNTQMFSCALQPLPDVSAAPVDRAAGSLTPDLAEAHWLAILRTGRAQDLPSVQIAGFAGLRSDGNADDVAAEARLMSARPYHVVANCLEHPQVWRSDAIATIQAPYDEFAQTRRGIVRIRYDSTNTFVQREGRWYASSGFARFTAWSGLKNSGSVHAGRERR